MAYSDKEKEKIFKKIFTLMSKDGHSLRKACEQIPIPPKTFYEWIDNDKEKSKQYARAAEERADVMFEDILKIVDATEDDIIINDEGNAITNHNVIQRDRLRADARKWMLSKMIPKKYGDKLDMNLDTSKIVPIITKRDE